VGSRADISCIIDASEVVVVRAVRGGIRSGADRPGILSTPLERKFRRLQQPDEPHPCGPIRTTA